jgi:hypothetical protein
LNLTLAEQLTQFLRVMQGSLFPALQEQLGPLTDKHKQLVEVLGLAPVEPLIGPGAGGVGRPEADRRAIARAFVAKAVYNMSTTRQLLDRLACDVALRRICGWERRCDVPHESVFSRAFAEFAASQLPQRLHQALIEATQKERLIGHISRDSTEIESREKPEPKSTATATKAAQPAPEPATAPLLPAATVPEPAAKTPESAPAVPAKPARKRGRPKKGEQPPPPEPTRLERQAGGMTLEQMLDDLPQACNVGSKRNSKGYQETWIGYKLHMDVADGQIPISCILTSASVHDSQVAIPLAVFTAQRVTNLYDLMDSAYDAEPIHQYSRNLGHIPIIDAHPRRDQERKAELEAEQKRQSILGFRFAEDIRFNERSTAERVNARLKDEFGGRMVRVRGNAKVMCHLMFGIVALAVDEILRLVT